MFFKTKNKHSSYNWCIIHIDLFKIIVKGTPGLLIDMSLKFWTTPIII